MFFTLRHPTPSEILVAWQTYEAANDDELTLAEGDVVELIEISDNVAAKKLKLDPDLDRVRSEGVLDASAAKHKLAVRPRRTRTSSRHSPNRSNVNARWLVRNVKSGKSGWVPCRVLQTADDPSVVKSGLPGDAAFRRQAVVKELVETEQEFVRDLDFLVQNYLLPSESGGKTPKIIKDNFHVLFGNLKEIAEFHRTVLMDGVKYYANEPALLGKAFLRLERDFDSHVNYCRDEHLAQEFLDASDAAYDYFADLSQRLGDDKTIVEHLKLPIQRINDYQLLLKELIRYGSCLDENTDDLRKAHELMLSVPSRAQDDKFTSSIEGYKGSVHKLGRLLAHDRFTVTFGDVSKERYLFLFKSRRLLICKVRRISEDRSVFQLKDIVKLPQVEVKDHADDEYTFELVDKTGGQTLKLKAHRERVKGNWLREIREFTKSEEEEILSSPSPPLVVAKSEVKIVEEEKSKSEVKIVELKAIEPLVQVNKPRVPEQKVAYQPKPPAEKVPGSALDKVFSIEGAQAQVVPSGTSVRVGVEFNVAVEEMSTRRYASASASSRTSATAEKEGAGGGGSYESSFMRRSGHKSSYSSDTTGLSSTRYDTLTSKYDSPTSKYDTLTSKYDSPTSKYDTLTSKYDSPTSKYDSSMSKYDTSTSKYDTQTSKYDTLTSKYSKIKRNLDEEEGEAGEEEDIYAKLSRKYSRSDSSTAPKYPRSTSVKKESLEPKEEDPYEKYARKYLRNQQQESAAGGEFSVRNVVDESSLKKSIETTTSTATVESSMSVKSQTSKQQQVTAEATSATKSAEDKLLEETDADRPHFIKTIRGTSIEPGENAYFEVTLKDQPFELTWLKDNKPLVEDGGRVQQQSSSGADAKDYSLIIKQVKEDDGGIYTAVARSEKEAKATCSAQLVVHKLTTAEREQRAKSDRPEFLVSMKDAELLENTYLRFMVKVVGEPNPDISFFKDGKKIPDAAGHRMQIVREHSDKGFYELVIPEVQKSDAGIYKCVATNKFGEASSEAIVTVTDHDRPTFLEGELLPAGEKPDFHWKKDGGPFEPDERFKVLMGDDEDSLALVFQHVKPDDVGMYTCVAQTSRGHISCSAELTVHGTVNQLFREPEKPRLIVERRDPIVTLGNQAMLELQVKGYPKPRVTFERDGESLEVGGKYKFLYEDEESVSLIIKDVESEDAGVYRILAENEMGSDTAEMKLTVKAPPKIKNKMEDISIHTDQLLKMSVEIEGIPESKVQFYKDGKELKQQQTDNLKILKEAEKYTLQMEKTRLSDTGSYSVVAMNELAQVSQFWKLDVYSKPKIVQKFGADKVAAQGDDLELKVKIEAEPKAQVKWYKDDQELEASEHYVLKEDGDWYMLRISGAVTTDASTYKFKAQNIHGTGEDGVRVDVKKAPKITQGLSDVTVTERQKNVTLDVKLEAFPKPKVSWYLDEMEIQETRAEFTRVESDDGVKLIIGEVSSELSGRYTCKLSNECGAVETSAKLTVNCAPRIIKHLSDTSVEEGAALHLEVEVDGCPPPTVKWLRNGREVNTDARIKITRDKRRYETLHLAVDLVKYEEQGEYEVIVTNSLGTVSSKSFVTVHKVTHTDAVEESGPEPFQIVQQQEEEEPSQLSTKAEPIILDTNMKDGARPESLDITYIVRGFANPPPEAAWTLNGKEIKPDAHLRMTASQNGEEFKLEIHKLQLKDAGVYECLLTNPVGSVRQQAVLDVTPEKELRRPKLIEGVKNQTITKKNAVTFQAVVVADPIPDVTWLRDGKPISIADYEKSKIVIETEDHDVGDGLKECTLKMTIPKCERFDQGQYTMQARNKWGELEDSARLTIVLRPEIDGPEDVKVVPGEATEFTVVVQANPEAQILWTKDGRPIEASPLISIVEDRANETYKLIFHKVMLSDEGDYKILAKNELGESVGEARLRTKTERPKFISGIQDDQIEDGGEFSLKVRADGLPKPEIKWFMNGKEITQNHQIQTCGDVQVTSTLTVTGYSDSDVGLYKAVAVNVVGEAETHGRISMVQTEPSLMKKLDRNLDVNEGEPLELKAKIGGSPKPKAIWYKDGEPISPKDDRIVTTILPDGTVKLQIDNCKATDSGAYKLVVKNPNGETSSLCAVAVAPKQRRPKFLKCFKDSEKVPLGSELRLEAQVEAYPPPQIKWLKDSVPLRPSANLRFETHPDGRVALVVDVMKPENAGKYELIVTNKLGEAVGCSVITTERKPTKPRFVQTLVPLTVVEGFPIKLEVKAEGFPQPKIKWTRNGTEIISDQRHVKITETPEAGTSALVIDSCNKLRDSLTYRAVALNEAGEAETSAPLEVRSAVKEDEPESRPILCKLKEVVVDEGQEMVIEAPFVGNPVPSVEWTKNGVALEPSERIMMTCDGKKVGLKIDRAVPTDAGIYAVTVTNPLGQDRTDGKAGVRKIFQPPAFTQRFTDLQQLPNRDAKFPCRVSGVPQPEVTWSKDGAGPLRESDKYHVKRDGDLCCLYVHDCRAEDAGVYRATATNPEGQAVCTAALEVVEEIKMQQKIEPPSFLKRIGDTELFKGMTGKFTACATGIPEPDVEWQHDGQKIFPSKRVRMDKDTAGLLRLTILGVDSDDLGKYSCKIVNEHGSDICHALLKFDEGLEINPKRPMTDQYTEFDKYKRSGAPVPIAEPPIVSQMTDRHLTLSWKPSIPSGPREPVTYQLEMCELGGDWFTVRTGIRSCACGVRNLEPFRDYKFRIRVENKYGVSDPSPYAQTHRQKLEPALPKFRPYLPKEIDFRPETSPYFPKDFDIERPPHDGMAQAPVFLRQQEPAQYGVKEQSGDLMWFVYGYPKPKVTFYFEDELIEPGGRFDWSYTRNGQATLFINKMLDRDVGWYECVARNEHGEARQRVRLEIAESPHFVRRPEVEYGLVRGRAQFVARIVGVPYPEIKWYRDWQPLAASSRIKINFREPDTTILTINDLIYKDAGLYTVSARNVAGTASAGASLYVEDDDREYGARTYTNISPIRPHKRPLADYYDLGDELGRGTQGVTYHAVERLNGRNWAVKVMRGAGADYRTWMYNELDALNQLRHKKLIALHDAYETDGGGLSVVMELGAGGELVPDYLLKTEFYTESDIAGFIRQLLQGLDYVHGRGYGHMGLNLGDLLIAHPGGDDLKLTDFSLARQISHAHLYPLLYGTPEYVSPECANNEGVGFAHDMWSVGIMTFILLSGRSPFRGRDDRETLTRIREGRWMFEDEWWGNISLEGRDFIGKLLVYHPDRRMDVRGALKHPWLERCDKRYEDEFRISSGYLRDYWSLYREWYDNASCRTWFRRRPLEGAFTHPSKMVYPPGEVYTPGPSPVREKATPRTRTTWEDQLPSRSPLNYEIGIFKSESHYQNGPDTYLLQLRDVDFPCRLRKYMKVAGGRCPGSSYILSDDNGYDWTTPIIRERRRFTDIMDEEIDDERKARINRYGAQEDAAAYVGGGGGSRRLKHELGSRLDAYVEAEAFLESKQEGRGPFFREKPQITAMVEGKDLELTCLAVGEPAPIVQWFKNDAIVAESHRIKIFTDVDGRSHYRLAPALAFDQGLYKIVARNKLGQTVARTRVVLGLVPDEPDSPEASDISDTEVLLTWKPPKHDGNSPVTFYRLEYKRADDTEWIKKAENVDHEFYLVSGLEPATAYIFRLAAKNAIGWSDSGVPTAPVTTRAAGTRKIQLSKAMSHAQSVTDAGGEDEEEEKPFKNDYKRENEPVEWEHSDIQEHYDFISEVSRGRYSQILLVREHDKPNERVLIAKILQMRDQKQKDDVEGEFAALRSLRHERIASLIAAYHSGGDKAVFIMEKLQGTDVLSYLATRHDYTEQTVATVVGQVLDGVRYLHWRGLCHLDLQPDNVVMVGSRSVQVKLVDLGAAHRVTKLGTRVPKVGHRDYIAPEVLAEEPAYPQTDIWSVGVLTYVMLSGTVPFRGRDEQETRQNVLFVRYRFENLYQEISQEATRFIMLLLKRQPNHRPTPDECHENRWLLPTDSMIKKRERNVFLGHRIREYSEEYHGEREQSAGKSDFPALVV